MTGRLVATYDSIGPRYFSCCLTVAADASLVRSASTVLFFRPSKLPARLLFVASLLFNQSLYSWYGATLVCDQCIVSWKLPVAMLAFHWLTARPLNEASMPAALRSLATI